MLRVTFNSDFFKNARFARVKSPAELVVSTVRMVGNYQGPRPGFNMLAMEFDVVTDLRKAITEHAEAEAEEAAIAFAAEAAGSEAAVEAVPAA